MSAGELRDVSDAEAVGNGQPPNASAHAAVAARAQAAAAERAHGPRASIEAPPAYAGLVTRAIAFAVDAAIVNLTGVAVGVVVGLALSILDTPAKVDSLLLAVGGGLFVIWTIAYFVVLWSTTGQTPGNRVMRIRVRRSGKDESLRPRWALVRLFGLFLAAVPLLLGFLPVLLNDRRRGLHDVLARSVVVSTAMAEAAETRAYAAAPSGYRQARTTGGRRLAR
jgi:uncharacterized RDD family membrane protein YckC